MVKVAHVGPPEVLLAHISCWGQGAHGGLWKGPKSENRTILNFFPTISGPQDLVQGYFWPQHGM